MQSNHNTPGAADAGEPPDLPPPLPTSAGATTPQAARVREPQAARTSVPPRAADAVGKAVPRRVERRSDEQEEDEDSGPGTPNPLVQSFLLWGAVSLIFAIVLVTKNNSAIVLRAGFFLKAFAVIVGVGFGATGAVIGDALHKFTRPDAFFTSGGMGQILWLKLFWMFGPQVIGMGLGTLLGTAIVLR